MPKPVGKLGAEFTLQTSPESVPAVVFPQELAGDAQAVVDTGQLEFGGVTAEHEPLHKIVPGPV
ncbi:MAG: hypothetical protein AAB513_02960 [Patescibacteria group bacterium]